MGPNHALAAATAASTRNGKAASTRAPGRPFLARGGIRKRRLSGVRLPLAAFTPAYGRL
jgi:hypothetical protein